jgi:hypothetical protein
MAQAACPPGGDASFVSGHLLEETDLVLVLVSCRALELAMRLDLAVSLMKEGSLVSPGTGAAAVLQ